MSSRLATLEEINQLLSSVIALNGQHWTDGNGNDVTGRQNSDYLTINMAARQQLFQWTSFIRIRLL